MATVNMAYSKYGKYFPFLENLSFYISFKSYFLRRAKTHLQLCLFKMQIVCICARMLLGTFLGGVTYRFLC